MQGNFVLAAVLTGAVGYLLGSINFAVLISKGIYGQDVRDLGSGNAGMTNIGRNYGKKAAIATLAGDAGKGILAVLAGRLLFTWLCPGVDVLYGAYIGAVLVNLGHMFPVFFGFRGGKGVATTGGAVLFIYPALGLLSILVFLFVTAMSKMVSLGSIIGIGVYPITTLLYCLLITHRLTVFSTICAALISGGMIWMHRENIARIRAGNERKIGEKRE